MAFVGGLQHLNAAILAWSEAMQGWRVRWDDALVGTRHSLAVGSIQR